MNINIANTISEHISDEQVKSWHEQTACDTLKDVRLSISRKYTYDDDGNAVASREIIYEAYIKAKHCGNKDGQRLEPYFHYAHDYCSTIAIQTCIQSYLRMETCEHEFRAIVDAFGKEFKNGTAQCVHCKLRTKRANASQPNQVIVKMSDGEDYVAAHPWPDTECFLQGGDDGIVLVDGDESYSTAFCEVFPRIGSLTTFIRGEGDDIVAAESSAFSQYLKMSECKMHEWERVKGHHGEQREDGYALCVKCKMYATALPPLTQCDVCSEPVYNPIKGKHFCNKHYFELSFQDTFEERLKTRSFLSCSAPYRKLSSYIRFKVNKALYHAVNMNDEVFAKVGKYHLGAYMCQLIGRELGVGPFQKNKIAVDFDDPRVLAFISAFEKAIPEILLNIKNNVSFKLSDMVILQN